MLLPPQPGARIKQGSDIFAILHKNTPNPLTNCWYKFPYPFDPFFGVFCCLPIRVRFHKIVLHHPKLHDPCDPVLREKRIPKKIFKFRITQNRQAWNKTMHAPKSRFPHRIPANPLSYPCQSVRVPVIFNEKNYRCNFIRFFRDVEVPFLRQTRLEEPNDCLNGRKRSYPVKL